MNAIHGRFVVEPVKLGGFSVPVAALERYADRIVALLVGDETVPTSVVYPVGLVIDAADCTARPAVTMKCQSFSDVDRVTGGGSANPVTPVAEANDICETTLVGNPPVI